MFIKLLIILLIFCEQVGFSGGADRITETINKVEADKPTVSFLLSDKEKIIEPLKIEKDEKIIDLPLFPLPIKKENVSVFNPACISACTLDFDTAVLLFAKEKDRKLPMASLAKTMTAFIILKDNKLDDEVTIEENSTKVSAEESQMGLNPGDKIKVRDLLYGLIIHSANDGAKALAEYKAGSEKKFTKLMNEEAQELGLKNTHFGSVSGMDAPDNYSSAYDLALLFKCVSQNHLFLQIINTKEYTFTSAQGTPYLLTNTDELLGTDPRIVGSKTGSTDQAGRCLISLASQNDHKVISVVMNCPNRFEETKRLLDWAYSSYTW